MTRNEFGQLLEDIHSIAQSLRSISKSCEDIKNTRVREHECENENVDLNDKPREFHI